MTVALFVAAQRTEHDVPHAVSCRALDVSESWLYKWLNRVPATRSCGAGVSTRRSRRPLMIRVAPRVACSELLFSMEELCDQAGASVWFTPPGGVAS